MRSSSHTVTSSAYSQRAGSDFPPPKGGGSGDPATLGILGHERNGRVIRMWNAPGALAG